MRRARAGGDARSLVDAALLGAFEATDSVENTAGWLARRNRAIAAAVAADPDDPSAAWLEAVVCSDAALCNAAGARRRLQALDPDNAQVWLLEPFDGTPASQQRLDAALSRAAAAPRFDDPFDAVAARIDEALQRAGWLAPPADVAGLVARNWGIEGGRLPSSAGLRRGEAMAAAAAVAFPSLQSLFAGCRPPQGAQRVDACRAVMAGMAGTGNRLYEAMGSRRMLELTAGTPQQAHWRERGRQQQWRAAQQAHVLRDPRLLDLRLTMNEADAIDVLLELNGRSATPPPGWTPTAPHAHAVLGLPPRG